MEIERKFTVKHLPDNLTDYPCLLIEQGYLCTAPVVRIRRQDDAFYLTYKGAGLLAREEYNLPLTAEAYLHLRPKTDGNLITKRRYRIPIHRPRFAPGYDPLTDRALSPGSSAESAIGAAHTAAAASETPYAAADPLAASVPDLTIELDLFDAPFQNLVIAEVEFPSEEMANAFLPPDWFERDVTFDERYHNSYLSRCKPESIDRVGGGD